MIYEGKPIEEFLVADNEQVHDLDPWRWNF